MKRREYLASTHEIYDAWKDIWIMNERRLRGGTEVLSELVPFRWEKGRNGRPSDSYLARQKEATYINFPDMLAQVIAGHLMREAPMPKSQDEGSSGSLDFGTLGSVELEGVSPDPAHLIYHNVDGTGKRGAQWDPWWMDTLKRSMATGHRWLFVESTLVRPTTREDEMRGLRPYVIELSPLAVPNWDLETGVLNFVILVLKERVFDIDQAGRVTSGSTKTRSTYLLMVRRGYHKFDVDGDKFGETGGWFRFDQEGEFLADGEGGPLQGTWDSTDGLIPMFPFYHERDKGSAELPAMSRPGLTPLGQVAVSYMNLSSAADFDAWDAGSSAKFIMGIQPGDHEKVIEQEEEGSKTVGVPWATDGEGKIVVPQLVDSQQGAVAADVWDRRLANKWEEARTLAAMESTGSPDTSGESKRVTFTANMEPKLATVAANLEEAQNNLIYFLELRWGNPRPTGSVAWPREFNLKDLVEDIRQLFSLENLTGIKNPELAGRLLVRALRELGLETDPERIKRIEAAYQQAARDLQVQRDREAAAFTGAGFE